MNKKNFVVPKIEQVDFKISDATMCTGSNINQGIASNGDVTSITEKTSY